MLTYIVIGIAFAPLAYGLARVALALIAQASYRPTYNAMPRRLRNAKLSSTERKANRLYNPRG